MNKKHEIRIRNELDILFIVIGLFIGIELAKLGDIQSFKILNITGLIFDIFGVLILTYIVASSEKVKSFICSWGAAISISIVAFIPIGIFTGVTFGVYVLGLQTNINVFINYGPVIFFCMGSIFFLEDLIFNVKLTYFDTQEKRIKSLGGYFLLSGLGIQLFASILDLLEPQ